LARAVASSAPLASSPRLGDGAAVERPRAGDTWRPSRACRPSPLSQGGLSTSAVARPLSSRRAARSSSFSSSGSSARQTARGSAPSCASAPEAGCWEGAFRGPESPPAAPSPRGRACLARALRLVRALGGLRLLARRLSGGAGRRRRGGRVRRVRAARASAAGQCQAGGKGGRQRSSHKRSFWEQSWSRPRGRLQAGPASERRISARLWRAAASHPTSTGEGSGRVGGPMEASAQLPCAALPAHRRRSAAVCST